MCAREGQSGGSPDGSNSAVEATATDRRGIRRRESARLLDRRRTTDDQQLPAL